MRSYASVGTCRRTLLSLSWIRFHLVDGLCGRSVWPFRALGPKDSCGGLARGAHAGATEPTGRTSAASAAQLLLQGVWWQLVKDSKLGGMVNYVSRRCEHQVPGHRFSGPTANLKPASRKSSKDCRLFTQRSTYYPNLMDASPTSLLLIDRHFCSVTGSKQLCHGRREASQRRLVNLSISVCRQVSTHHAQRAPAKKKLLVAAHFQ